MSLESPHLAAIAPLDGSRHCGFLNGDGSISQSVVFDAGKYTIRFDRTVPDREAGPFPALHLTLDGRVLLTLESVTVHDGRDKKAWKRYTSPAFTVTAGPHTIGFSNGDGRNESNYGLRGANFIDNVAINHQSK